MSTKVGRRARQSPSMKSTSPTPSSTLNPSVRGRARILVTKRERLHVCSPSFSLRRELTKSSCSESRHVSSMPPFHGGVLYQITSPKFNFARRICTIWVFPIIAIVICSAGFRKSRRGLCTGHMDNPRNRDGAVAQPAPRVPPLRSNAAIDLVCLFQR